MKVFLINLLKNKKRLDECKAQLNKIRVDFDRFPAIYGKKIPIGLKRRVVRRFLWWCHGGRKVMDGEIGCALSHLAIYRKMVKNKIDMACILEDDVVLDGRFPEQLAKIEAWLDVRGPQVVLLSNHSKFKGPDTWFIREVGGASFSEGYVLTLPAAKAMLDVNYPLRVAADSWEFFKKRGGVRLFQAFPSVCSQKWSEDYVSDVFEESNRHNSPRRHGFVYVFGRVFGKIVDFLV